MRHWKPALAITLVLLLLLTAATLDFLDHQANMLILYPPDCRLDRPRPHWTQTGFRIGKQTLEFTCSDGRYAVPVDLEPVKENGEEQYSLSIEPRRDGHRF